jgi:hypothetical protein
METWQERRERIVGMDWLTTYRFSPTNWLKSKVGRLFFGVWPRSKQSRMALMKAGISGRCWTDVSFVFFKSLEQLYDDSEALALALQACATYQNDYAVSKVLELARQSESVESILVRAAKGLLFCASDSELSPDALFVLALRDHCRERWIGLLWDMKGEQAATAELVRVPLDEMSSKERSIWVGSLIERGELDAARLLLREGPDLQNLAYLSQTIGDYVSAREHYSCLAESDHEQERRFGLEGLEYLENLERRGDQGRSKFYGKDV